MVLQEMVKTDILQHYYIAFTLERIPLTYTAYWVYNKKRILQNTICRMG